ncbi:MAG: hypothetical protein ACJA0J_001887, partial [Bdellovibrionota bacterium]
AHPRHLSSSVDNNIKKKISLLKKKPVKPILQCLNTINALYPI